MIKKKIQGSPTPPPYNGPHLSRCSYCQQQIERSAWDAHLKSCTKRKVLENFIPWAQEEDIAECPSCGLRVSAKRIHFHLISCIRFAHDDITPGHHDFKPCSYCQVLISNNRFRIHDDTCPAKPKPVRISAHAVSSENLVQQSNIKESSLPSKKELPKPDSSGNVFFMDADGELNFGTKKEDDSDRFKNITRYVKKSTTKKRIPEISKSSQINNQKPPTPSVSKPSLPFIKEYSNTEAIIAKLHLPNNRSCPFCGDSLNNAQMHTHFSQIHHFVVYLLSLEQILTLKGELSFRCTSCDRRMTLNQARAHWLWHDAGISETAILHTILTQESSKSQHKPQKPAKQERTHSGLTKCPDCGDLVKKIGLHRAVEHPWCPYCKITLTKAERHEHFEKHGIIASNTASK